MNDINKKEINEKKNSEESKLLLEKRQKYLDEKENTIKVKEKK